MRILVFIDSLLNGGAARKVSLLTAEFIKKGHDVTLAACTAPNGLYAFDSRINHINLDEGMTKRGSMMWRVLHRMRLIRKIVIAEDPDIILSILPHVSFQVKLGTLFLNKPIVFSDETSFARKEDKLTHYIRWRFYRFADSVVLLTHNDEQLLGKKYPQKTVIYNPLGYSILQGEEKREKSILAIGATRLWSVKGLDLLIKAWSQIYNKYPDWHIDIYGEREESTERYLHELRESMGVPKNCMIFHGENSSIDEVMRKSSIFALSSRIEGFSLALVEALSQGCPCVAFDSQGVISEVTDNGRGVIIVQDGDVDKYAAALEKLILDKSYRDTLSRQGKKIVEKYCPSVIADQWIELFSQLIEKV